MTKFITEEIKETIGFHFVENNLMLDSPYGKYLFKHLPKYTKEELMREYELIDLIIQNLDDLMELKPILQQIKDIRTSIKYCKDKKVLDLIDLYEIKQQVLLMKRVRHIVNNLNFSQLRLENSDHVIELLSENKNQISADFYIYNSYSEPLKNIRIKKREIEHRFYQATEKERETLKEERRELVMLEEEEEFKVRKYLSHTLMKDVELLEKNIKKIAHIDLLIGKAILAKTYQATKPILNDDTLALYDMEHPLIKLQVEQLGNHYTKNEIIMEIGTTVLTGANMSGKTSILKTIAFNVLLAHYGFFLFANKGFIPYVAGIRYIGLEKSQAMHGLSSFGHEITAMNDVIKEMKQANYLICMDEFARSTNPTEGQKFIRAFARFANTYPSFTLLSTHYDGVVDQKMNHYQILGLKEKTNQENIKYAIHDIYHLMNYTLMKVKEKKEVPKEAYKISLLLDIDEDFKTYLDQSYEE